MNLSNKLKSSNGKVQAALTPQGYLLHARDFLHVLQQNTFEYELLNQAVSIKKIHDHQHYAELNAETGVELDSMFREIEQYEILNQDMLEISPNGAPQAITAMNDYRSLINNQYRTSNPKNIAKVQLLLQALLHLGYKSLKHLPFISRLAAVTYRKHNIYPIVIRRPKNAARIIALAKIQLDSINENPQPNFLIPQSKVIDCRQNNEYFHHEVGVQLNLICLHKWINEGTRIKADRIHLIWYNWHIMHQLNQMTLNTKGAIEREQEINIFANDETEDYDEKLKPVWNDQGGLATNIFDLELLKYSIQKVCDFVEEKLETKEKNPALLPIDKKPEKPNHIKDVTIGNLYPFLTDGIGEKTYMGKMLKMFFKDGMPYMKPIGWLEIHKGIGARFTGSRAPRPVYDAIRGYNKEFNPKTDGLVFLWDGDYVQFNSAIIPRQPDL